MPANHISLPIYAPVISLTVYNKRICIMNYVYTYVWTLQIQSHILSYM